MENEVITTTTTTTTTTNILRPATTTSTKEFRVDWLLYKRILTYLHLEAHNTLRRVHSLINQLTNQISRRNWVIYAVTQLRPLDIIVR